VVVTSSRKVCTCNALRFVDAQCVSSWYVMLVQQDMCVGSSEEIKDPTLALRKLVRGGVI